MKGSTIKRGNTWTAYWFTTDPATGKRKQHSKGGFRTKGAAQEHLNDVLGKVQTGAWAPDKKITVGELLTEWLAAKRSQGLRATTLAQYQNVIDSWLVPHVGAVQLAKMSPSQAQQLVGVLRAEGSRTSGALSSRSVQLSITVLKAATSWALEAGLVGRDPLAGYRRPRAQTAKGAGAAWTVDEARAFLVAVSDDRLVAAWTLLLTRGLRRGELAGLGWDAVDLEGGSLQITRTACWLEVSPSTQCRRQRPDAGRSRSTRRSSPASSRTRRSRVRSDGPQERRGAMRATSSRTSSARRCTPNSSRPASRRLSAERNCAGFAYTTHDTPPPASCWQAART